MHKHIPHVVRAASLCVAGALVLITGCKESADNSGNLLTDPSSVQNADKSIREMFAPRNLGEDAVPIRDLKNRDGIAGDDVPVPSDTTVDPAPEPFHEVIPEYSREFDMYHIEGTTDYVDEDGVIWKHIVGGPWDTYYSPNPDAIPPGTPFHEVGGAWDTKIVPMWHISLGKYASYYFDPTGGGSVWCHIPYGEWASYYRPMGSYHVPTGDNATSYERHDLGYDPSEIPSNTVKH